jgi:hypothetical protein
VTAKLVIVVTQRSEGAESVGQVVVVGVIQGYGSGATVEAGSWKNAVGEVVREVRVFLEELL